MLHQVYWNYVNYAAAASEKPCLEENEIEASEKNKENSIECSASNMWFHWRCIDISAEIEGDWFCQGCKDTN